MKVNGRTVWSHGDGEDYHARAEDGYVLLTLSGGGYDIAVLRN